MGELCNFDKLSTARADFLAGRPVDSGVVHSDILSSWKRSKQKGVCSTSNILPAVTDQDVERGKSHVTGYTAHIRTSSAYYFQQEQELLERARACICYVSTSLDIYGRYGCQELKDELKSINLRLGANLAEDRVGTNAAALCAQSGTDTWVIGKEHYCSALHSYACFSFPVQSGYHKRCFVLLIIRCLDLTPLTQSMFRFIKSGELIVSSGRTTSDIHLKNDLLEYQMNRNGTILIVINQKGIVTYVNDVFLQLFHLSVSDTINCRLSSLLPPLGFALDSLTTGTGFSTKEVSLPNLDPGKSLYFMDATAVKEHGLITGMVMTLTREQNISNLVHKVTNLNAKFSFDDLIGQSPLFLRSKEMAKRVSHSPSTVLIVGESGTGKELFAHSLHNESPRRSLPFISVNCAAIPRELIGSELFGYASGAFTGANKNGAQGKFELANGGTLFLDEIAEMPLDMQSVLLRVLEDKTITRIGSSKAVPVDVRLVAATNKDLQIYVNNGQFRLDLYYRLNVIQLTMIPLRERTEDIPLLARHLLTQFTISLHKNITGITPDALAILCAYSWPGNIRELRNVMERGVNIAIGSVLTTADLPSSLTGAKDFPPSSGLELTPSLSLSHMNETMDLHKIELANKLLAKYHGNKSKVAKDMGIARTTLYRLLKK